MTFSIVARDPETGDLGGAVQSKFLSVGSLVLHGRVGAGMVATQAWANVAYGPRGLALHRRYFRRPSDDELVELAGPLAAEVAGQLSRRGAGPVDPGDPAALWAALAGWAGLENLEERLIRPGWIDPTTLNAVREG